MRILVTNDDGFRAPGLVAQANRLVAAGHEVIVTAPQRQQSGGSAALGRVKDGAAIAWERFTSDEMPGIAQGIAIDAPPALAVKAVLGGMFGPAPDIVMSGINRGWNTGGSTLHSGTLGAAMTACSLGWRAAAISCARPPEDNLETAAEVAAAVAEVLGRATGPVALNVNVPNLAVTRLRGVRQVPVGAQGLLDVDIERVGDELRFKLVPRRPAPESDCDGQAVLAGYVAVSPLNGRYGQHAAASGSEYGEAIFDRLQAG